MENKLTHIDNIDVISYRKLSNLKIDNIGQFNLIVGDNNVGKTSLLEAILFTVYSFASNKERVLLQMFETFSFRNNEFNHYNEDKINRFLFDNFHYFSSNNEIKIEYTISNENNIFSLKKFDPDKDFNQLSEKAKNIIEYDGSLKQNSFVFDFNGFLDVGKVNSSYYFMDYFPFIAHNANYGKDITDFFSDIQKNEEIYNKFVKSIEYFIPKVKKIAIDANDGIIIFEGDDKIAKPLFNYGSGAIQFFRILSEIHVYEDRFLLIDEIDTGIHYSRFKDYWKVILQTAQSLNVQIFATTHSEECIYYFRKALEELETENQKNKQRFSDNARLISLREIRNGVKAFNYVMEDLQYASEVGRELRGGL